VGLTANIGFRRLVLGVGAEEPYRVLVERMSDGALTEGQG